METPYPLAHQARAPGNLGSKPCAAGAEDDEGRIFIAATGR